MALLWIPLTQAEGGAQFLSFFFLAPFAEPSAEEGEERAGTGAEGIPRVRDRDRDGPCPDPLRRSGARGTRWLLRALAQAQMALGTLAETKVPRLPGRDPANIYRRRRRPI